MKQELDEQLCKNYPLMMVNRNKDMKETCMCWGFECGDGWFNILNNLMGNIQIHIDWKNKQREFAIQYNEMLIKMKAGDFTTFEEYSTKWKDDYRDLMKERMLQEGFRDVPELVAQVTLDQVKEKFGTLRFYYSGGDDYIRGLVSMAESMSGSTCEECGNIGKSVGGGWITTLCETHAHERGIYNTDKA